MFMGFPNIYELFYLFTMIKAVDSVTRGNPIPDQPAWPLDPWSVDLLSIAMATREGVKDIYANLQKRYPASPEQLKNKQINVLVQIVNGDILHTSPVW